MPFVPPQQRKPEKPRHDTFDKASLVVAIIGVGVLAITAIIMAWQAILFSRQLSEMKNDKRPWVGVSTVQVAPVVDGSSMETTLSYNNSGQSPAINVRVYAVAGVRSSAELPITIPEIPDNIPGMMMLPNMGEQNKVFTSADTFDAGTARKINNGDLTLRVAGRIEYQDVNHALHMTTFVFRYNPAYKGYTGDPQGSDAN